VATLRLQRLAVQIGKADHYVVTERLDEVNYEITLYTVVLPPSYRDNPTTRTGYWCWDFRDATGTPLVLGAGLGSGVDLLFPFRGYAACPPGKLFVWTSDNLDPGLDSFAEERAVLYYQSIADVIASGGSV
jgi:hypothetical protein